MKPIHLICLLTIALGISCEKEAGPSSYDLLTGKPWKLSVYVLQYPNEEPIDGMTILQNCERDDEYVFLEDDSYMLLDKLFRCPNTAPDIKESGVWNVSDDGKKLFIGNTVHELLKLTNDSLVVKETSAMYTWTKTKRFIHK
jgi:hypothetical protein